MNLLEYQAKKLLNHHELPVPASWLVHKITSFPDNIEYPVVAKSQVPVGGRGKAGGIVGVDSADELSSVIEQVFNLSIKGHVPSAILLEEKLKVSRELYLAIRLNRDERMIDWMASPHGGVEIENNADSIVYLPHDLPDVNARLANTLQVDENQIIPLIKQISQCFKSSDLTLLEINPLVVTDDGKLVCADAKCVVDDNARFRQPNLPWPAQTTNLPQPLGGTIGCIANGAGMAMSTMDTIVAMGGKPANFLDIGGGTGEKEFVSALKNIMDLPGVTSIIINIFAGISRCDEIARGIIAAREQLPDLPPLFIRLEGTNRDIALQLLTDAGIGIEPDLKTCVEKAMEIRS